jgi:hypothetical protein
MILFGPRNLRTCRGCGCDDDHACVTADGACAWVLLDLDTPTGVCSACAVEAGWDQRLFAFPEWTGVDGAEEAA